MRSQAHARPQERRKVYIGRRTFRSPARPTIHLPVTDGHPRAPAVFVGCDRTGSPARSSACRIAGRLFAVSKAATLVGASRSLSKRRRWRATTRGGASKRDQRRQGRRGKRGRRSSNRRRDAYSSSLGRPHVIGHLCRPRPFEVAAPRMCRLRPIAYAAMPVPRGSFNGTVARSVRCTAAHSICSASTGCTV